MRNEEEWKRMIKGMTREEGEVIGLWENDRKRQLRIEETRDGKEEVEGRGMEGQGTPILY